MDSILSRSQTWDPVLPIVLQLLEERFSPAFGFLGLALDDRVQVIQCAGRHAGHITDRDTGLADDLVRAVCADGPVVSRPDVADAIPVPGTDVACRSYLGAVLKGLLHDGCAALVVGDATPREFGDADVRFLSDLALLLVVQANLARLQDEARLQRQSERATHALRDRHRAMHLEVLNYVSESVRQGVQFNEIAEATLDQLLQGLGTVYGALYFGLDGAWILVAHRGFDDQFPLTAGFLPAAMLPWAENTEPVADFEPGEPLAGLFASAHARSWVLVPLLEEDQVRGGMILASRETEFFDKELLSMFGRIAGQLQAAMAQAELARELADQTANLAAIIRSLSDALIEVTADRNVLQANAAAKEMLGERSSRSRAESWHDLVPLHGVHGDLPAGDDHPLQRAFYEARVQPATQWRLAREGKTVYVSATAAPIVDEGSQQARAVVLVMRDITEQRAQEQKLLSAEKHASVSSLAAGVAHEFKNYLGGIMGNASLVEQHVKGHEAIAGPMKRILDIGARANQTALALLSYVRNTDVESQISDIGAVLGEVICLVDQAATEQKIVIVRDFDVDICTEGVPGKLKQVFLNLLNNAIEAMPEGGTLSLLLKARDDRAVITITDTGVGIPAENLSKVFDPFFSSKGVWGEQSGAGKGLGLTTSLNYAREQGGDLRLESKQGEGTRVTVTLPLAQRPEPEGAGDSARTLSPAVLVMETDPEVRAGLSHVLEGLGWQMTACDTAAEFEAAMATEAPGAVFLDAQMPGKINFIRAYEAFREASPGSRIFVSTGEATDYQLDEYIRSAAGRIVKPASQETLQSFVERHLGNRRVPA